MPSKTISKFDEAVIDIIAEKRRFMNMSQSEFAFALGTTPGFIGQIEAKKRKYNINHLNKIARVFKCSPCDLLPKEIIED